MPNERQMHVVLASPTEGVGISESAPTSGQTVRYIGERTEFMVHAKSTAPGKSWPPSPATPYPFQCSAQMSVNSRREVSRSSAILPLSRSLSARLPSSCSARRPMSIDWMREGGAVRIAW